MLRTHLASLLAVVVLGTPAAAAAQSADVEMADDDQGRLEIAAHAGRRFGGLVRVPGVELPLDLEDTSAWSVEAGWRLSRHLAAGVFLARQNARLRDRAAAATVAHTFLEIQHVALWLRPEGSAIRPEIGLSAGRTRFGLLEGGGDHHPSMGFALGGRARLVGPLELLLRGQFFATLLGGSGRILCGGTTSPCLRTSNDTVLLQLQASTGIAVRF